MLRPDFPVSANLCIADPVSVAAAEQSRMMIGIAKGRRRRELAPRIPPSRNEVRKVITDQMEQDDRAARTWSAGPGSESAKIVSDLQLSSVIVRGTSPALSWAEQRE